MSSFAMVSRRILSFSCLLLVFLLVQYAAAQNRPPNQRDISLLIRVLESKGVLTREEAARIDALATDNAANQQLVALLLTKGIISRSDYEQLFLGATVVTASTSLTSIPLPVPAVYRVPENISSPFLSSRDVPLPAAPAPSDSATPITIPAITPTRVFPVGGLPREGLKPAFSIGSIRVTPYVS